MSKGDKQTQSNKPKEKDQFNTKNDLTGGKKAAPGKENEQNRSNKDDKSWQKR